MHQMKTIQARQDTRSQPSTPEPKCTGQNFQVIIHQEENGKRASGTRRHVLEAAASLVLRADLEDGEEETPSLEPRTARAQESLVDESARAISEGGGRGESEQRVAARPARKEPSRVTTGRTKRPGKRQGSRNDASRLQNGTRSALVPNERQPLGKSQVGAATLAWLGIATEKLASDYLRVCSEIVDLNRSKSAEEQVCSHPAYGDAPFYLPLFNYLQNPCMTLVLARLPMAHMVRAHANNACSSVGSTYPSGAASIQSDPVGGRR